MRILGLSTATKIMSLGLIDEEKVLVETSLQNIQSEKILFYVKEAGIEPSQIEGMAVTIGPGSYSGLRGGVATAKTLAQTLKIPLIGISTLEAVAYNLVDLEGTMAVVTDARADEYNFALFGATSRKLKRLTRDLVLKFDHLVEKLSKVQGILYLMGVISEIHERILEKNPKSQMRIVDPIHSYPYGINVAKLGLIYLKQGKGDAYLTLVPSYSHEPNLF